MSILLQNKLLAAAEAKVVQQLTPKIRDNYTRVVVAGMKVALNKGEKGILVSLKDSEDPIKDSVVGAVNIVGVLAREARGTIPLQAIIPGAMTLMLHGLDFVSKARLAKVGKKQLVRATKLFTDLVFERMNISPEMVEKATFSAQAAARNPDVMQKMKEQAGVVVAPGAEKAPGGPAMGGNNGV